MYLNKKGFSLIFAIFLLVVFGIIGTAVLSMLSTSSEITSEDFLSTQAFYLAESGAEIRIYQAIKNDSTTTKKYYFYIKPEYKITTQLKNVVTIPNGKKLAEVESRGKIYNIRRTVMVKFWY